MANIEAVVPEPALKIKKVGFNSQIQTKFFDVMSSDSGKNFKIGSYAHVGTILKAFPATIPVQQNLFPEQCCVFREPIG